MSLISKRLGCADSIIHSNQLILFISIYVIVAIWNSFNLYSCQINWFIHTMHSSNYYILFNSLTYITSKEFKKKIINLFIVRVNIYCFISRKSQVACKMGRRRIHMILKTIFTVHSIPLSRFSFWRHWRRRKCHSSVHPSALSADNTTNGYCIWLLSVVSRATISVI